MGGLFSFNRVRVNLFIFCSHFTFSLSPGLDNRTMTETSSLLWIGQRISSTEWTTTQNADGLYTVKGGAWDSSRDAYRTEYSDDARDPQQGYVNVGFRVVRVDR